MEILQKDGKLSSFKLQIPIDTGPKVDHEFQDLALQMIQHFRPKYPSAVWSLFHKIEYPVPIVRETWIEYQKQPVKSFLYFMAMLNTKAGVKKKEK